MENKKDYANLKIALFLTALLCTLPYITYWLFIANLGFFGDLAAAISIFQAVTLLVFAIFTVISVFTRKDNKGSKLEKSAKNKR